MYLYNDIALSIVSDLNTRILNMSFSKLIENDTGILPLNEYIPKIWENKWFNNNTIPGYSKGDAVWKYTMTSSDFLYHYNELIYDYANENLILNGYFKYDKGEYLTTDEECLRYLNVINGYSEYRPIFDTNGDIKFDENGNVEQTLLQILPPLFEYGLYDSSTNHPIEIYVSLIDNNKEFLSNSLAWTNITLTNILAFRQYISTELSLMFDEHIKNYHLNGITSSTDFSEILLKRDFSNFDISALYNALRMTNHFTYINDQGFDYVIKFIKLPINIILNNRKYTLYKWCRLWNSGHLEHGGIVEIPLCDISHSTEISNYAIKIDLSWPNNELLLYDYPLVNDFYGLVTNNLYFANDVEYTNYSLSNDLDPMHRYSICLTPVLFNERDVIFSNDTIKLRDENVISRTTYPTLANNDYNKTFVNFETHSIQNDSFYITRSRTDDLTENDTIRYVLYYTSGYRLSITRSYNILSCYVKGLYDIYEYTGSEITPKIYVYSNDNILLEQDVNYKLTYRDNINRTLSAKIEITGINPYFGTLIKTFAIKKRLNSDNYLITNISLYDKFQ